jgi:hypothetical protein
MVFPWEQPASLIKSGIKEAKNFFSSLFGNNSEMEQLKPLSFADAQLLSLRFFLDENFELLKNLEFPAWSKMFSLEKFVGEVYSVYRQLQEWKTCGELVECWEAPTIAEVNSQEL